MKKFKEDFLKEILKFNEEEKGFCVDGRILYKKLKVGAEYSTWIKRRIEKYNFIENIDFIKFNRSEKSQNTYVNTKEYSLTVDMSKQLCRLERSNPNASEILKILYTIDGNIEPIIKEQRRLEYQFGDMLEKITRLEWKKQYPIDNGKFRLDFYLENVLIVEYDEEQHIYNKEEDKERIEYCRDWIAKHEGDDSEWRCPVIRVVKGKELEGLNRIIKHLVGFEEIDGCNYNIMDTCDYGNR